MSALQYYIIFAGGWSVVNGLLHDIFILRERRPFEKELIRLMIDGHILIFSGIFYWVSVSGLSTPNSLAYIICIITAIFLLGYCAWIFKMLPSIGTIAVNLIALIWLLIAFL